MAVRYQDYITRSFSTLNRIRDQFPLLLNTGITLESSSFNKINLKVNISSDIIEIPCIVLNTLLPTIHTARVVQSTHSEETILIPMFRNGSSYAYRVTPKEVKSAAPLLKHLFMETPGMDILNWCKCGNTLYYGGPGILFYEDMTPMIMFSLLVEKVEEYKLKPLRAIVRVNPKVYTSDDLMSKHIRTKMLCSIMEMYRDSTLIYTGNNTLSENNFSPNFKVIVEDFTKDWFDCPTVPDVNVTSEAIGDFIANNFTEYDF